MRVVALVALALMGCASDPVPPPRGPEVAVTFEPENAKAKLERTSAVAGEWETVCTGPCRRTVRPDRVYRVGGDEVAESRPFVLGGPTTIAARTGSASNRSTGSLLLGLGIPAMILGGLVTLGALAGGGGHGANNSETALWSGLVFLTGGVMTVSGAVLRSANDTSVDLQTAAPIAKLTLRF